jgi:tRNA (cytidine/uridine-2'-O-)-methyltransferase
MRKKMRLALYEPDIPQNAGTLMRLGACLGVPVDIIEPCGFVFDERRMRRAGMDYLDRVDLTRHVSWTAYEAARLEQGRRLILLTTKADSAYTDFEFTSEDTVLLGRESAGVPDEVHQAADARIIVPMTEDARSLNVAVAAAMVLGEGLRQTDGFSLISN